MKYEIIEDGSAVEASRLGELTPIKWTEADMQYVVGLNPHLLGVVHDLPVGRDGGSTEHMSDMLYVDEVGRATIVELKRTNGSLQALAQLLGYGDHERNLPIGEIERRYLVAEHGWETDWHTRALTCVRSLARAGRSPAQRAPVIPPHGSVRKTFAQASKDEWGKQDFSLRGTPPRLILITKNCESCVELTQLLQSRQMNIRLIDADLSQSADGRLVLDWRPYDAPPELELMWEATRYLWRDDFIRANFEPNGWAEHSSSSCVSFSSRGEGRVRFYLSHHDRRRVHIEATVPPKWCEEPERSRLNRVLSSTLADVPRLFSLPKEQDKFVDATRKLARTLLEVLTPAA